MSESPNPRVEIFYPDRFDNPFQDSFLIRVIAFARVHVEGLEHPLGVCSRTKVAVPGSAERHWGQVMIGGAAGW